MKWMWYGLESIIRYRIFIESSSDIHQICSIIKLRSKKKKRNSEKMILYLKMKGNVTIMHFYSQDSLELFKLLEPLEALI